MLNEIYDFLKNESGIRYRDTVVLGISGGPDSMALLKLMLTLKEEMDLVDNGLRYDLTVPLVRYYSKNANDLPSPFKALQMGNVWRADRPQR